MIKPTDRRSGKRPARMRLNSHNKLCFTSSPPSLIISGRMPSMPGLLPRFSRFMHEHDLCQSWQCCRMYMKFRQSITFKKPQLVLLSEKGAHGVSARRDKVCALLPQRSQGGTLKKHMHFVANSTTVASQTDPVSHVYMASASQPASGNWQAMTAQSKLQKIAACASQKQEADNTSYVGYKA